MIETKKVNKIKELIHVIPKVIKTKVLKIPIVNKIKVLIIPAVVKNQGTDSHKSQYIVIGRSYEI